MSQTGMASVTAKELKTFLRLAVQTEGGPQIVVPWVWGPPGVGKSSVVAQLAEELKCDLIDLRLALLEPSDLTGLPFSEGGETRFLPPRLLPKKGKGILFLDELNRAREDTINAAFQLILDRKVGEYTLPDEWSMVVAGNLGDEDKTIVREGDSALWTRCMHVRLKPDLFEWKDYMEGKGDPLVSNFLGTNTQFFLKEAELAPYPNPRTWTKLAQMLSKIDPRADLGMLFTMACGLVGSNAALALRKFAQEGFEIEPQDVLKNFEKYRDKITEMAKNKRDSFIQLLESLTEVIIKEEKFTAKSVNILTEIYTKIAPRDQAIALAKRLAGKEDARAKKLVNKLTENPEMIKLLSGQLE